MSSRQAASVEVTAYISISTIYPIYPSSKKKHQFIVGRGISSPFPVNYNLETSKKDILTLSQNACCLTEIVIWEENDALRDLVSFVQFKKHEKHPWKSATFSKACHFTKSNTHLWVFFTIFKLCTWYQIT